MKKKLLALGLALITLLGGCSTPLGISTEADQEEAPPIVEVVEELPPKFEEIVILGVGDIMVHGPQLKAQYQGDKNEYDFRNNFQYIQGHLQNADYAIGNLETTFGGGERGYSSYPRFNTPDTLADALKDAGFHLMATANNHTYDTGKSGVIRTLEVLETRGLKTMGTRKHEGEEGYHLESIKGVQVGFTAYTYETPRWNGHRTINAMQLDEDAVKLIDTFGYETLEEDLARIQQRVALMKEEGAEVIVMYIHWGEEYQREPNHYQKQIAQFLCDAGVDIVFGSHPHVPQRAEILTSQDGTRETLVVYSMGNFLSNQRREIIERPYTEEGLMVAARIEINLNTKEVSLKEANYIPTWVHRYQQGGKTYYEIVPAVEAMKDPEGYHLFTEISRQRVLETLEHTLELLNPTEPRIKIDSYEGEI